MKLLFLLLAVSWIAAADGSGVMTSQHIARDFRLTADPAAPHWKDAPSVVAENGPMGNPVPGHRTEIRSRWSNGHLYFLFIAPYETLHLKPNPTQTAETNKLWDWDVAEVFIGADFKNIRRYKEFQVSPQGEWVDLDIDRDSPKPEDGWVWNAPGYEVKARIDEANQVWYGEMKIPFASIDTRRPEAGNEFRVNLYRIQGPPPERRGIAWQPTHSRSYHVPEAFGRLLLTK
jgi:hypothetical protein